jgi:type IV pilus assembly protein PilA
MNRRAKSRNGFTLVELAVVIVIIGVLSAIGVPHFLKAVERSKAAEAFNYLAALRSSQERFILKNGVYWCGTIDAATGSMTTDLGLSTDETLDIMQAPPKYFGGSEDGAASITVIMTTGMIPGEAKWYCRLIRLEATSSYGPYVVAFDQDGYLPPEGDPAYRLPPGGGASTIPGEVSPMGK